LFLYFLQIVRPGFTLSKSPFAIVLLDTGKGQIMFIIRTVFWLSVVALLLPTEDGPQKSAGKTQTPSQVASVPARNVTVQLDGFCARNLDVCAAGSLLFDTLQRKAKYAARLAYDWAYAGTDERTLKPRRTGRPQQTA